MCLAFNLLRTLNRDHCYQPPFSHPNHASCTQAIAEHSLLGYEQHVAVLECPGLVEATVDCISRCPQATVEAHHSKRPPPVSLSNDGQVAAAIEAAISLTVSKQGLQVRAAAIAEPIALRLRVRASHRTVDLYRAHTMCMADPAMQVPGFRS